MNAQLEAAHAAVPAIADYHRRKARVDELLRSLPAVETPEAEAARVADEVAEEYLTSGTWPADVEQRAQEAYTRAVGAHAVRSRFLALHRDYTGAATLVSLRQAYRAEILEALGVQLADLLQEAKQHVPALGSVRDADAALAAGGAAAEAYTKLKPLVSVLSGIREAQWSALSQGELTGPGSLYSRAKASGHGDVQGVNDETPARQVDVMRARAYDLDHLVFLVQIGTAYIPESVDEVIAAQDAFETRHSVPDDLPRVVDISPTVTPNRAPSPPNRGAETRGEREAVARSRQNR
ncbi:hypothetical protein OHB49_08150 [Streptomyces sp. NBC_01717]|uniref:hypothetical protein n=1 Tax=unclassified Streptomyces TaxID=2593676 RepID=UPI002E38227B|nr:hypothetical protein [Streptomyces sp. NBC_01717]WTE62221.1 hypothetical protein OG784_27355 [Streptomyces sp. NBC_01617]